MNILVTNDDGIDSRGLWPLVEAMSRVGEVLVVAPSSQQSGTGSSLSLHSDTSIKEVPSSIRGVQAYSIGGTPSDCVILGIGRLSGDKRIGLLVSGINHGANMGRDILYSGTVMATLQGYFRKIPSIAMSLAIMNRDREPDFGFAATVAEHLARRIQDGTLPTDAILNTNSGTVGIIRLRDRVGGQAPPAGPSPGSGLRASSPRGRRPGHGCALLPWPRKTAFDTSPVPAARWNTPRAPISGQSHPT